MVTIRKILILFVVAVTAALPQSVSADEIPEFDAGSCNALIYYHKKTGPALLARMASEGMVKDQHEKLRDDAIKFENQEKEADKLYKPGWLSVVMNGGSALLGAVHAGAFLVKRVRGFWDLLDEYNDKVLKKKKVLASDKIFFEAMDSMSRQLYREGRHLVNMQWYLGPYFTGTAKITAADLSDNLLRITETLERMENIVDQAYDTLWLYMEMRTGPWNSEYFYVRSIKRQSDVIAEAREQWLTSIKRITGVPAGSDGMVNPTTPSESAKHLEREETDRKIHKALQEVRIGS